MFLGQLGGTSKGAQGGAVGIGESGGGCSGIGAGRLREVVRRFGKGEEEGQ